MLLHLVFWIFFFQEKLEIQIFLVNVEGERNRSAQILGTDLKKKKKNTKNYLTTSPDQNKTCLWATHGLEPPVCSFRLGDNT